MEFIIGFSEDHELIIGEFAIKERNGKREFTASFNSVIPFVATEDYILERIESSLDGLGGEEKYHICEQYDLKPSELVDFIYTNDGIEGAVDISLFSDSFYIDSISEDVYFESSSCGQYDWRENFGKGTYFVNKVFVDLIMRMWDKFHLSEIDEKLEEEILELYEQELNKDCDSFIQKYLEEWVEG